MDGELQIICKGTLLICSNVGFQSVLDRAMPETNGKQPEIVYAMYQLVSFSRTHLYLS
jgi:hypothetical protein